MASFVKAIAVLLLTFALAGNHVYGFRRDSKCTTNDPRQIYPYCMFGGRTKTLWCDQSNYEKLPSVSEINSHLYDVDCITADALFVNDSCLKKLDRGDMRPYKEIRIFLGGQNYISVLKNLIFHENQKLEEIDLGDNRIIKIEKRSLEGLRFLKRLRLDNNGISHVNPHVFKDLSRLEELSMENNFLQGIEHRLLTRQRNLRRLNLKGNSVVKIDDFAFEGNPNLRQLHLDGNDIEIVTANTFLGLQRLEILTISHNRIKFWPIECGVLFSNVHTLHLGSNQLEEFSLSHTANMTNLQNLLLDNNSLSAIHEDLFLSTPRLAHLNLSGNDLEEIPERSFMSLCHLESLILTKNKLQTPKEGWFRHLVNKASETTYIAIAENQWICDCKALGFKKFQDTLGQRKDGASRILSERLEIRCHGPDLAKNLVLDRNLSVEIEIKLKCPVQRKSELEKHYAAGTQSICDYAQSFSREYFAVSSQFDPRRERQVILAESTLKADESKSFEPIANNGLLVGVVFGVLLAIAVIAVACSKLRGRLKG